MSRLDEEKLPVHNDVDDGNGNDDGRGLAVAVLGTVT